MFGFLLQKPETTMVGITTGFCRLWLGEEYREFCFRKDGAFLPSNKSTMCPQEPALDGAGGERNAELAAGRASVTGINT